MKVSKFIRLSLSPPARRVADVVQHYAGSIPIETLFVDEGFTTLDEQSRVGTGRRAPASWSSASRSRPEAAPWRAAVFRRQS